MEPSQPLQIRLPFFKTPGSATTIWYFLGYTIQFPKISKRVFCTQLQPKQYGMSSDRVFCRAMDQDNINYAAIWPTSPKKISLLLSITQSSKPYGTNSHIFDLLAHAQIVSVEVFLNFAHILKLSLCSYFSWVFMIRSIILVDKFY